MSLPSIRDNLEYCATVALPVELVESEAPSRKRAKRLRRDTFEHESCITNLNHIWIIIFYTCRIFGDSDGNKNSVSSTTGNSSISKNQHISESIRFESFNGKSHVNLGNVLFGTAHVVAPSNTMNTGQRGWWSLFFFLLLPSKKMGLVRSLNNLYKYCI